METRKAMFSGSWYPATASACESEINAFLETPGIEKSTRQPIRGGIVPHAGWYYSGAIACNVIHQLSGSAPADVLFIFGMHLHRGSPSYIMCDGEWETPFGNLSIESGCADALAEQFDFQIETAHRFTQDNTIELQLPFVKYFFPDASIVPIGAPPRPESLDIGKNAVRIAEQRGLRAKIVGSTDLTHYGSNYGFQPKGSGPEAVQWVKDENDKRIIDAMLALDPQQVLKEALAHQNACCAGAAATAIAAGKALGATQAECLSYATSYDKRPGDSLVGYVGITF
ncbi:COG1355, Predicted dioxygenase [Olavius algarvensis associated proteobacterium Delta 3]|nr:COG1355, Predicted dioxygenase [Olavius algarvensis associated proteobacterium Delta 3]CAB5157190.1 COG1355, Predicted dioxygenase [Olavius algarvensis associated proteobacterium Delta 3]